MRKKLLSTLVAVTISTLLGGTVAYANFSYTEDFGTGDNVYLSDLGWSYVSPYYDGALVATTTAADRTGTTGRALDYVVSPISESYGYLKMKKVIPGLTAPTSGLWIFSAVVNAPKPTDPDPYAYGGGSQRSRVGVSNGNTWMADWRAYKGNEGYEPYDAAPTWVLDYGGFMSSNSGSWMPAYNNNLGAQPYLFDTPVVTSIFMDFDHKQIWGTVSNGNPAQTLASPIINWTASAPVINSFCIQMYQYYDCVGFDVDNITMASVPEPGSLVAFVTGLIGLAGVAIRRRN